MTFTREPKRRNDRWVFLSYKMKMSPKNYVGERNKAEFEKLWKKREI